MSNATKVGIEGDFLRATEQYNVALKGLERDIEESFAVYRPTSVEIEATSNSFVSLLEKESGRLASEEAALALSQEEQKLFDAFQAISNLRTFFLKFRTAFQTVQNFQTQIQALSKIKNNFSGIHTAALQKVLDLMSKDISRYYLAMHPTEDVDDIRLTVLEDGVEFDYTFHGKRVYPILNNLGEVAAAILVKRRARREFHQVHDLKRQWQVKRGKGHGVDAKQESFKRWYTKHIGSKNCVYVFWAKRRCVYVGRTLHGHGRPAGWFDRVWFQPVTRIDIYSISTPSRVPKAECLAMHLFDPSENDYWPSIGKYTKKCPICGATKEIEQELKSIFRLR